MRVIISINVIDYISNMHLTDHSEAFQAAINAAGEHVVKHHKYWPNVSGKVFIPSGVYTISKTLKIPSGVSIEGDSMASTVLLSCLTGTDPVLLCEDEYDTYNSKISNLHLRSTNMGAGVAIKLIKANRACILSDLFIEDFKAGIILWETFTALIRDCTIYNCSSMGILGLNATNFEMSKVKIENCLGHGAIFKDSSINTSTGISLTSNVFQGNAYAGLKLHNLDHGLFTGNFFESNNRAERRQNRHNDSFAQIEISAVKKTFNRRNFNNGNLHFLSCFITGGKIVPHNSIAVKISRAGIVTFDGGYIRSNRVTKLPGRFEKGFSLQNVHVANIKNIYFGRAMEPIEIKDKVGDIHIDGCLNKYLPNEHDYAEPTTKVQLPKPNFKEMYKNHVSMSEEENSNFEEKHLQQLCSKILNKGDLIYSIGEASDQVLKLLSSSVSEGGKVVSFPTNDAELNDQQDQLHIQKFANVDILQDLVFANSLDNSESIPCFSPLSFLRIKSQQNILNILYKIEDVIEAENPMISMTINTSPLSNHIFEFLDYHGYLLCDYQGNRIRNKQDLRRSLKLCPTREYNAFTINSFMQY